MKRREKSALAALLTLLVTACQPRATLEQAGVEMTGRVQFGAHELLFTPVNGETPVDLLFDWSVGTGGVNVRIEEQLARRLGKTLMEYRADPSPGCLLVHGPRYRMPRFRFDRETHRGNGFGYHGEHERAILVQDLQRVPCPA